MNKPAIKFDFKPSDISRARLLSEEQIRFYNENGYITPIDIFNSREAAENRQYVDSLLAQIDSGTGAYAINCYQARCEGIWDVCTNSKILDYVEELIGPNIICWASHYFCKMPHDPKVVPWHQDALFWQLSPTRTVTVWLAIDDADEENSAMQFIPGTHTKGYIESREKTGDTALNKEIADFESLGTPVSNNLKAGQMSMHADLLAHGSEANQSERRRCGLTIRYCPPEVSVTDDQWGSAVESIICRGEDPTGKWKHFPRPSGNDISSLNGPKSIGGN